MNQEQIVDKIVIDIVEKKVPGIKKELKKMTRFQKRKSILSILDTDRKLFLDYNRMIKKVDCYSKHADEVVFKLRDYVKVADVEKEKFGEVMTPISLVDDMLNKLPEEVWCNPNLKWLDPCNGVGTFPSVVIQRLMKGLEEVIPNAKKRYRHIIEEMIYVCELQAKNMFIFHCVFDREDIYELNTYFGSFLDDKFDAHMKNVWGVEKFDIVIGNPPYNSSGETATGNVIWNKFVVKSFDILYEKGLLCMVHPTIWRKPQSNKSQIKEVSDLMLSKQILYLEMHNVADGLKTFGAGTRYDFYVIENKPTYKKTIINDETRVDCKINLKGVSFIPNKNISLFDSVVTKNNDLKCNVVFNCSYDARNEYVSEERSTIFKYPLVHSTPKSGNRFKYSSRNDKGLFNISKVIFGESGINDVIIDMSGEYGMTQCAIGIEVSTKKEAEDLKKCLMSEKFKDFLSSNMWSNFRIDWCLFQYLKKDFYKQFLND